MHMQWMQKKNVHITFIIDIVPKFIQSNYFSVKLKLNIVLKLSRAYDYNQNCISMSLDPKYYNNLGDTGPNTTTKFGVAEP